MVELIRLTALTLFFSPKGDSHRLPAKTWLREWNAVWSFHWVGLTIVEAGKTEVKILSYCKCCMIQWAGLSIGIRNLWFCRTSLLRFGRRIYRGLDWKDSNFGNFCGSFNDGRGSGIKGVGGSRDLGGQPLKHMYICNTSCWGIAVLTFNDVLTLREWGLTGV